MGEDAFKSETQRSQGEDPAAPLPLNYFVPVEFNKSKERWRRVGNVALVEIAVTGFLFWKFGTSGFTGALSDSQALAAIFVLAGMVTWVFARVMSYGQVEERFYSRSDATDFTRPPSKKT